MSLKIKLSYILYLISYILFTIYSYAFLDVGLTLTSFRQYLEFQEKMRWFGYFNRPMSTLIFIFLCSSLYTLYFMLYTFINKAKIPLTKILLAAILISGILILAYPAFSHDIFNYIFNAKMVLIYHADPHKIAAWNFPDPMLGFMRNIHTPAPYFYGWTIISLIPFILGLNRIFVEIISFKVFSVALFLLTYIVLNKILQKLKFANIHKRLHLFLLNPLILIEAIGVGHNDFSMMLPVLLSFYFLIIYKEKKLLKYLLSSIFCLLFSISTKYASVILLPLFVCWYFKNDFDLGLWGAILLFLIPFSRPLDQLHSWYLLWPLTWVFLAKNTKAVYFFCLLSFFALLRYAPYIWYGNWDPPVPIQRLIIYLLLPGLLLIIGVLRKLMGNSNFFFNKTK